MRKLIALMFTIGVVLAVPTLASGDVVETAAKSGSDANPACRDIVDGSGSLVSGTVGLQLLLAAAPCKAGAYTVTVYSDSTMQEELASTSTYTDLGVTDVGTWAIGFTATVNDADGVVCLVATTSVGNHVVDRAPDSGCTSVESGGGSLPGFH